LLGLNELLNSRMLLVGEAPSMWLGGAVLLRGGTVLDIDGERVADVLVGPDGRVAEVGAGLVGEPVEDVSGLLVVPGGVDAHTHM
jgi:dihydroorotase-like cyclic amidohydrolase